MMRLAVALDLPPDHCSFLCLPGHAPGETLRDITAAQWLNSFEEQYRNAVPDTGEVVYLGYSLGGLLMTCLLGQGRVEPPRKQVLFAPALAFQQWTRIPTLISATTFDQLLIPSFTPRGYKANPGVTIGTYKALFEISRELEDLDPATYNIPTLVLCDQRDELVLPTGLQQFIEEKGLTQWQLHILPSGRWAQWGKKHLLVAKEYQTDAHWQEIKDRVDDFIHD